MLKHIKSILLILCISTFTVQGEEVKAATNSVIKKAMDEKNIPGAAVGIYINGQPYLLYYGAADQASNRPVNAETLFALASITKVFTSTLLALEVQAGKASLSDPAVRYLRLPVNRDSAFNRVTLEELATHTSSLPRVPPKKGGAYTLPDLMQYLGSWKPEQRIGTHYLYSNLGFGILGFDVADIARTTYYEALRAAILDPLKMNSTFLNIPEEFNRTVAQGYSLYGKPTAPLSVRYILAAAGGLVSNLTDMMAFLKANMNLEGPKELLSAMQFAQQGHFKVNDNLTLGLGWQRFSGGKTLLIDKNGGLEGFSSYIGFSPEYKIGVVLLFNKGKTNATGIGRELLHALIKP